MSQLDIIIRDNIIIIYIIYLYIIYHNNHHWVQQFCWVWNKARICCVGNCVFNIKANNFISFNNEETVVLLSSLGVRCIIPSRNKWDNGAELQMGHWVVVWAEQEKEGKQEIKVFSLSSEVALYFMLHHHHLPTVVLGQIRWWLYLFQYQPVS